jgi:hypothetical protein
MIMDNIWTQDLWIQIKEALPDIRMVAECY